MKADDLINTMKGFVGIVENPPGSNQTQIGLEFGWNGVAWCAETVSVACRRLGFPLHEAAVSRIVAHAKAGDYGMGWTRTPTRGAAVCYDWKGNGNPNEMHVGVVEEVLQNGTFWAIEGNYHDQCLRVLRDMKFVNGFATFPFDGASVPTPPPAPPAQSTDGNPYCPLATDGAIGPQTIKALQWRLNKDGAHLTVDGQYGPDTKKMIQARLNATNPPVSIDGEIGPQTIKALQAHVGVGQDGSWGPQTTQALQRSLNSGSF